MGLGGRGRGRGVRVGETVPWEGVVHEQLPALCKGCKVCGLGLSNRCMPLQASKPLQTYPPWLIGAPPHLNPDTQNSQPLSLSPPPPRFLLDALPAWESFAGAAGGKAPRVYQLPFPMQV